LSAAAAPGFVAPRWLSGAHAQTIYASLLCPRPSIAYRRERWDTPDGDFIDVDFTDQDQPATPGAPWLVIFHGLEGSSQSHYARALMDMAMRRGWQGAVPHFRGCGGEPNRLARAYHSGDTDEVDWVMHRLAQQARGAPLYVIGVSLGGNALLKWLGERGSAAGELVTAAASVCAPLDLAAAGASLERGFARFYAWGFLNTMRQKAMDKLVRFPGLFDGEQMRNARTMREFDELFTAPLHGFLGADDYWTRASSKPGLRAIEVPTLVINALDDPFLPAAALPRPDQVSARVTLDYPASGGHVGFVDGPPPGRSNWIANRLEHFLGLPGSS